MTVDTAPVQLDTGMQTAYTNSLAKLKTLGRKLYEPVILRALSIMENQFPNEAVSGLPPLSFPEYRVRQQIAFPESFDGYMEAFDDSLRSLIASGAVATERYIDDRESPASAWRLTEAGREPLAAVITAAESASKRIGPWTNCPHCGADASQQQVRNYDMTWGDGDVYCTACGGYVRSWDRD